MDGPNHYRLTREGMMTLMDDMAAMPRTPRIVNERGEDPPIVLRLEPDSPWRRLGFEDRDVLRAINGLYLTSPAVALEAYAAVRNASKYVVTVMRNGHEVDLTITIVERL